MVKGGDRSATIAFAARGAGVQLEQNIKPAPRLERKHPVRDFVHGVFAHGLTALGAEGHAHACVKQPQIIVNLGRGRHRRARIARRVLLPDGHRRRDPDHLVNVGFLHAFQELARVGGEGFDVATLALGIDRVKGQAGLAGARYSGDHRDPVVRDFAVDVPEIVHARPANHDGLLARVLVAPAVILRRRGFRGGCRRQIPTVLHVDSRARALLPSA